MSVPQWNADIITQDVEAEAEIQANGGLEKDSAGALGVKVDGETVTINNEGELEAAGGTVDQIYNASSTNAQSGTAVAGAITGVRQVPSTQSSDNGKVLGVTDSSGTLGWVSAGGGSDIPLPALSSSDCLRFEFESSSFDPSQDPNLSQFMWVHVTADPSRNIWDWCNTSSTYHGIFSGSISASCDIIDGVLDRTGSYWDMDFYDMFYGCSGLHNVQFVIKREDTQAVTFTEMFKSCGGLVSVKLGNNRAYNLAGQCDNMFANCTNLRTVDFYNTVDEHAGYLKVKTSAASMFNYCQNLVEINNVDFSTYNMSEAINFNAAFYSCSSLKTIPGSSFWGIVYASDIENMFYGCGSLNSGFPDALYVTGSNVRQAFLSCHNLRRIKVWMNNATDASRMFSDCVSLVDVEVNDPMSVTTATRMFYGCASLSSLPKSLGQCIPNMPLVDVESMFEGCVNVADNSASSLYTSMSGVASITSHDKTFLYCGSNTTTGSDALAQIPTSWGGTMA